MLKSLLATLALGAALVTTPALADQYRPHDPPGQSRHWQAPHHAGNWYSRSHWQQPHHRPGWAYYKPVPRPYYAPRPHWYR